MGEEFEKDYFKNLLSFLTKEYNERVIYPKMENIFSALNFVPYEKVKVVIIGQDPYHGENQAMGMSFSVPKEQDVPPSLKNIFKEIESDTGVVCDKTNGDLSRWAKQGVLLLNSVLTVRAHQPNSHKGMGWEKLTTRIIEKLNERDQPIVFVLWGGNAKAFEKYITNPKHVVLKSAHPSPLSAYNGFWGCKHFSTINEILIKNNNEPIDWR